MKSCSKSVWRPVSGAIVVGAMAFAVVAYAAPRTTDKAAPRTDVSSVRSESAQLVTGSPEHLQAVAGTPPTAIIRVVPGPARVGAYPAGTTIVGSELSSPAGGFRAWFEYQVGDWDPNNDGTPPDHPGTVQCKIDAMGYLDADTSDPGVSVADDGDQDDLAPAVVACANNAACIAAFGEAWAKCESLTCKASYVDKAGAHPASYCSDFGSGPCDQGDCASNTANHSCFAITAAPRPDDGQIKYFASHVLDIPAGAKGRYTVGLLTGETFLAALTSPPVDIETLSETGFTVNIRTGSCCSNLSVVPATCEDGVLQSECGDNEIGPFVWTDGKACAQGCVECVTDAGCNDGDSCSTETCNVAIGVCQRGCVAGWDIATECCNGAGANAVITTIDDGDACTADSCSGGAPGACTSPDPENGNAQHPPAAGPCDDGNPCTTPDRCDGANSEEDGGCTGTDINTLPCAVIGDCPEGAQSCNGTTCVCSLTPKVTFEVNSHAPKTCVGGFTPGAECAKNEDCAGQGAYCDLFADGANCFNIGEKINAVVHVGPAASPINGGQFQIDYDPSCLKYNGLTALGVYSTIVAPIVNEGLGKIFVAVGVDPFGNQNGPGGNVDMVQLSFFMFGECGKCELNIVSKNPQNSYLVDDEGQRIVIETQPKELNANGDLELIIPGNIKTNADCDGPTAIETWGGAGGGNGPSASFSCGDVNMVCRGAHESGAVYPQNVVLNGGVMYGGASSFCCYASAKDKCDQTIGCQGPANDCDIGDDGKQVGCWTVQVNDETSLDVDVQLCPPIRHDGELERCIKFCLYSTTDQDPICQYQDVVFGGLSNFVGKYRDKIKIPGTKQWGCITAQDQLHTLRSCYYFNHATDCIGGELHAEFAGDPDLDGNCLIGGNLDGWKKDVPGSQPSLDVIDILDFGTFVAQFGGPCNGTGDTPCGFPGPNGDIDGDGCVTMDDYTTLLANFMASAKDCCGEPQTGAVLPANPVLSISVDELRQLGMADLISADLNGDGLVNAEDMDAFMQGARPSKVNNGRGGKGLRSGR